MIQVSPELGFHNYLMKLTAHSLIARVCLHGKGTHEEVLKAGTQWLCLGFSLEIH